MEQHIEKTEARQGERRRWQEHVLYLSTFGAAVVLGGAALIFIFATGGNG